MSKIFLYMTVGFLLLPLLSEAQNTSKYLPEKPGKWSIRSNLKRPGTNYSDFTKNVLAVAEWFHQNSSIMTNPRGFDLDVTVFGIWDDYYVTRPCNYGLRCELNFDFELFLLDNGKEAKWTVEPPHWSFDINNTESGHGTNFHFEGYDDSKDDASLKTTLDNVTCRLNDLFVVPAFKKDIAPGVSLYNDGTLIIYNPDRPPFWLPVTVREVVDLKLAFYSIREDDRKSIYPYLKDVVSKMTKEELDSPAYDGGEDRIIGVTGGKNGFQIMRFNKDYWDKSLPPSAIQFITIYYIPADEYDMDEYIRNNNHPDYAQLVRNSLKLSDLQTLVSKGK